MTAIIGANGSGKSTLIRLLCTLEKPDTGTFSVNGLQIEGKALADYRLKIGYVPQDVRFVSTMKCNDALAYTGWVAGMNKSDVARRIPQVLSEVGLQDKERARTGSLSGGQNRRLGIAAAMMHEPWLLFLDEPTAGLDPHARADVRSTIEKLSAKTSVVFSSHVTGDIDELAQHVIALHDGHKMFEGDWDTLLRQAKHIYPSSETQDPLEVSLAYVQQLRRSQEVTR